MSERKRILVVGGVAGGASAAARARRLCEDCDIVIFDRGEHVSFANCGLPYYVGNVIEEKDQLVISSPQQFEERFRIEVHTRHNVLEIDREGKEIVVQNLLTGEIKRDFYTHLVLSPGARALRPPIPGIDKEGIFVLRTIPDSQLIRDWIEKTGVERAVVVGAGFIGLEMAENLRHRGLDVTLVEMADQVLPPLDAEMAASLQEHIEANGITLRLRDGVSAFAEGEEEGLEVHTQSGAVLKADLVILSIGVCPEDTLAREAGLSIGSRGGIVVDDSMRTSDPCIWAVGDAIVVRDVVLDEPALVPLAGPANRQGRIAANSIMGRTSTFRGVQGTAVCGVFGLAAASTGASEKSLQRAGITDYEKVYLYPGHHVGYYPGAKPIHLKLLFRASDGLILGAQALGEEGVVRRIDVFAMALQMKATVFDLEEAELCYAPQYGAAKDPVNIAGMIAANVLRGDHPLVHWEGFESGEDLLIDVRETHEYAEGHIPHAINIPLSQLRSRVDELTKDRALLLYCRVGQRGYYATRALLQLGFDAKNLSGGMMSYMAHNASESKH